MKFLKYILFILIFNDNLFSSIPDDTSENDSSVYNSSIDPSLIYQMNMQAELQREQLKFEREKLREDRLNQMEMQKRQIELEKKQINKSDNSSVQLGGKRFLYIVLGTFLVGTAGTLRKFTWISNKVFQAKDWTSDRLADGWNLTKKGGLEIKEFFSGKDYVEGNDEVQEFFSELEKMLKKIRKDKSAVDTLSHPSHIEIGTATRIHRYYLKNKYGDKAFSRNLFLNKTIAKRFTKEDMQKLGVFKLNLINRKIEDVGIDKKFFRNEIGIQE